MSGSTWLLPPSSAPGGADADDDDATPLAAERVVASLRSRARSARRQQLTADESA
jgi:hypothetical protein